MKFALGGRGEFPDNGKNQRENFGHFPGYGKKLEFFPNIRKMWEICFQGGSSGSEFDKLQRVKKGQ